METSSEEFKLVALENYEFKNWQYTINNWIISHVQLFKISI